MSQIIVYVQDVNLGVPAKGVPVRLEQRCECRWLTVATGVTDVDGSIDEFIPIGAGAKAGSYRLTFDTNQYFERQGILPLFKSARVEFSITEDAEYVLPLLLSPFSYMVYRGS